MKISQKEKIEFIKLDAKQKELMFWIDRIETIVKDATDLMYMTPMSALSILKSNMQKVVCDYQHQSDNLKLKIVKRGKDAT